MLSAIAAVIALLPLRPTPTAPRARPTVAQQGWITGVDQGGQAYYFREATGEFQYDPPPPVMQNYGGRILWSVSGRSGIHYWCNYGLKNGDVQVLSACGGPAEAPWPRRRGG